MSWYFFFLAGFCLSSVVTRIDSGDHTNIEYPSAILAISVVAIILDKKSK